MKTIFAPVLLAFASISCNTTSGPTVRVNVPVDTLLKIQNNQIAELKHQVQILNQKRVQDSIAIEEVFEMAYLADTNAKTAIAAVQGITKKAIKRYNRSAILGGILDGVTGRKISGITKNLEEAKEALFKPIPAEE